MKNESVKIEDLSGIYLDYAITAHVLQFPLTIDYLPGNRIRAILTKIEGVNKAFSPSSFWAEAGPLIQQYGVSLISGVNGAWTASVNDSRAYTSFDPIEAALRALVAHKNPELEAVDFSWR